MNIYDAVKLATEKGYGITTPEFKDCGKIIPTNERGNCIVVNEIEGTSSKYGWQPCLDDLLRTDWEVKA